MRSRFILRAAGMVALAALGALAAPSCVLHPHDPNPCLTEPTPLPLACGIGACSMLIDACEGGLPASCVPPMPDTVDICDGVDNDCDGLVDEGCACDTGKVHGCYLGSPATRNVGACRDGLQQCTSGMLGPCTDHVLPSAEVCDDIFDNDCDGEVNEGCPCTEGAVESCYGGPLETLFASGVCQAGAHQCVGGAWSECLGDVVPGFDIIDGVDNDCNGAVDDCPGCTSCIVGEQFDCYSGAPELVGVGICKSGVQTCVEGHWSSCEGEVVPRPETCNGLDDDCNGIIDDGLLC
jgi:hypothetical protein